MPKEREYESLYASLLPLVQKPGRYLGNEYGVVRKDPSSVALRVALAFPDVYEIAQSHPGLQILYDLLNRRPDVYAERVYAPWVDMEALLRQRQLPLVSLETFTPLSAFDILGFTLQYELTYTNLLNMLDLGGIPLFAKDRDLSFPLILAGGPCAFNPEPLAPFLDAVLLGDGEEAVHEICDVVRELRPRQNKQALLDALRRIPGVYVPAFFEPKYSPTGQILSIEPRYADYTQVTKRIVRDLDDVPPRETFLVPIVQVVHDRPSIEVMRGCVKGCRFCQAGYIYRPLRERNPRRVVSEALTAAFATGQEEISLLSLSTGDYSCINPVLKELVNRLEPTRVAVSLPSTRVDALAPAILEQIRRVRKTGFTLAPEAGSQRLRDIIQKEYSEAELLEAAALVFKLGWRHLKLYFMLGLPGETLDDLRCIAELCAKVRQLAPRGVEVVASVSNFVPKSHTPFQWMRQLSLEETLARQEFLRGELQKVRVSFRYHDARLSVLEGIFSRGDRQLARTLHRAFELGCRFDGWTDQCRFDLWEQALRDTGVDVAHELRRRFLDEVLPWDHLSAGVTKQFLQRELARAFEGRLTPDCSVARCTYCGACDFERIRNVDYHVTGSKAAEHRGTLIRHWAAEVVGVNPEGDEWEPRGWKKVHRPDSLEQRHAAALPSGHNLPEPPSYFPGSNHSSKKVEVLGTAEEWIEANGEGTLRPRVGGNGPQPKCRIRLRYTKVGRARFVGSVELTNIFYRAIRRAALPVAFTQGHHPLPKVSFGPALPFGIESEHELADLFLAEAQDPETLCQRFNAELPLGITVVEAWEVPLQARSLGKSIVGARYAVDLSKVIEQRGLSWTLDRIRSFCFAGKCLPSGDGEQTHPPDADCNSGLFLEFHSPALLTFEIRAGARGTSKPYNLLQELFDLTKEQTLALVIRKVQTVLGEHPLTPAPVAEHVPAPLTP
ncbi:hypothetical protein HRbin30_01382 [bacterium HR30]|nr:hypothetical protein HRbin30_01382 [bacterium HR30]